MAKVKEKEEPRVLEEYVCTRECFWNNSLTAEGQKVFVPAGSLKKDKRFKTTHLFKEVEKDGTLSDEYLSKEDVDYFLRDLADKSATTGKVAK